MTGPAGVGLVVVSHSSALARAAIALASEMVHGRPVRIAAAAGLSESVFGTDALRIKAAIEQVDGPDGVVLLMDMGSAVLSAELALDLIEDPALRARVTLSSAPVVEGLVVAAVAAAGGASREEVAAEARDALHGKRRHLADTPTPDTGRTAVDPGSADAKAFLRFVVTNTHGLHARPAARLVAEMRGVGADVQLRNLSTGAGPAPATSMSRLAGLGVRQGHVVEAVASGPRAPYALELLNSLVLNRFGEASADESAPSSVLAPELVDGVLGPLPAAPGIVIGPARRLVSAIPTVDTPPQGSPQDEWRSVTLALAGARREIENSRVRASARTSDSAGAIFEAHQALLADPELLGEVQAQVTAGASAAAAWSHGIASLEQVWAGLDDDYLRERVADVSAVGQQVLRALTGHQAARPSGAGILVVRDLSPGEVAELDPAIVTGVLCARGSASSHAAILARASGIAMVVGAGDGVLDLAEGTVVAIDGATGELDVSPDPRRVRELEERQQRLVEQRRQQEQAARQPAVTRDGTRVHVLANVGTPGDAVAASGMGAEGAGLVRTEFLFLGRDTAPDASEQEKDYAAILDALPGRRVVLRTLDVGGDKPLSYLPLPSEQNPFLGLRGLRLSLRSPELFREQLVAICAVAQDRPVDVMFPMVCGVDELMSARAMLVNAAGGVLPDGLRVGIMVETPAAALKLATFVGLVDFVSIGTNDLTQYVMAAERGSDTVGALSDALDPGVLQLMAGVHAVSTSADIEVSVCGEIASDLDAVPVLVGLGICALSVSPRDVPRVKARVRELDIVSCTTLAEQALLLPDAAAVRALVLSSLT